MTIELNIAHRMLICAVTGRVEGPRSDEKRKRAALILQKTSISEDESSSAKHTKDGMLILPGKKAIEYDRDEIHLICTLFAEADFFPASEELRIQEVEKLLDQALSEKG